MRHYGRGMRIAGDAERSKDSPAIDPGSVATASWTFGQTRMKRSRRIAELAASSLFAAFLAVSSPALAYGGGVTVGIGLGLINPTPVQLQVFTKGKAIEPHGPIEPVEGPTVVKRKKNMKSMPELDPSAVGSAAVLLLGGLLVATGRRRRLSGNSLGDDSPTPPA
jgi:hypothetical protein